MFFVATHHRDKTSTPSLSSSHLPFIFVTVCFMHHAAIRHTDTCMFPLPSLLSAGCFMCFFVAIHYTTPHPFFLFVCLFYALRCHTSRPSTSPRCLRSSTLVSVMFLHGHTHPTDRRSSLACYCLLSVCFCWEIPHDILFWQCSFLVAFYTII